MMADTGNGSRSIRLPTTRLVGMVLAGGRSERMGTDKALLPHPSGDTFLGHATALLRTVCQRVVVAGRARDPSVGEDDRLDWLIERPPSRGPIAGLAATMQWATGWPASEAVLAIPVDMPGLQAEHLESLLQAYQQSPGELISVSFDGTFAEPLLAIYPLRFTDTLTERSLGGERSLARWLQRQSPTLVRLDADALPNINTPDQFDDWRARADS